MNFSSYESRNKNIKRIIFWSVIIGGILALFFSRTSVSTFAQPADVCEQIGGCVQGINQLSRGRDGVIELILRLVRIAIFISAGVAILFIVIGAYQMITSRGDDEVYASGLKTLRNSVLGLILAILSITIVSLIAGSLPGFQL